MKRPNFNEKTAVKVISHDYIWEGHDLYGFRGTVKEIRGLKLDEGHDIPVVVHAPYSPEYYPNLWSVVVEIEVDGQKHDFQFDDYASQLEPVQHKFIDIDYIREEDLVIGKKEDGTDAIRHKNTGAFEPGDIIQITTKIDGANASIAWDETTGKLEIFSRTNLLNKPGALRGFYDYVKTEVEPKLDMSKHPDLVIFGEWLVKHSVNYENECYNKWYIYDIWDKRLGQYVCQSIVQGFCREYHLNYVEELYYGPFISWDHCRSFIGKSTAYGPEQEGIVVKNQTKLGNLDNRNPVYIKIVDEKFKEHMSNKEHKQKEIDPIKEVEKQKAIELIATVVTEARVKKHILKLIDEGVLPESLEPKDIGKCMKELPKRMFEDILKEEPEVVKQAGEHAGKCCSMQTAVLVRKVILGN